jgi:hypothetical protein
MTFKELQDFTMLSRFNEGQRGTVKTWVNYQWAKVWSGYDWEWKHVGPTNVAVTSGDSSPPMPTDFANALGLFNEDGDPLAPLPPGEFDRRYQGEEPGTPEAFKVVANQVYLGPTPDASETMQLAYLRRVGYHAAGDTSSFTVGSMLNDSDVPAFLPVEHHPLIGLRAARMGMRLEQDPSWRELEEELREAEAFMVAELLPDPGGETLQYGRDTWGL